LGDYQAALDAGQEAVQLHRQLGDRMGLGWALCYAGNMAAFQGDLALAEQALMEAIRIGRELGNPVILCFALGVLSHYVALPRGDIAAARAYAEESTRFAQEIGMSWATAMSELVLARICSITGQLDEARRYGLQAMAVFQDLRDPITLIQAYNELADIELSAGYLAEARRYLRQSLAAGQELDQRAFVAHALESFAFIAQAQNQPLRATRLLGAAEAVREGLGTSAVGVHRLEADYQKAIAWLHTQLDDSAYAAHWSEGHAMSLGQAVAYALEELNAPELN
jgi:tetratricopeptide (TPR) repeat protein